MIPLPTEGEGWVRGCNNSFENFSILISNRYLKFKEKHSKNYETPFTLILSLQGRGVILATH